MQRQQAAQRAEQLRHTQAKNSAVSSEDELQESVNSADELQPIGEKNQKEKQGKNQHPPHQPESSDDENGQTDHVNLTA